MKSYTKNIEDLKCGDIIEDSAGEYARIIEIPDLGFIRTINQYETLDELDYRELVRSKAPDDHIIEVFEPETEEDDELISLLGC